MHLFFLINCQRAESYGFQEYYWLGERAIFAISNHGHEIVNANIILY